MSDCTHGMPSPASCVDCMAEGNMAPPPKAEPEWVHTTRDRYVHVGCVSRAR